MDSKKSLYNKSLKNLTRELRNNSTLGEILLWDKYLKAKKMEFQFNRQYAMKVEGLDIIVDFICRKLKLIIEIDGYSHQFKYEEDRIRDEKLHSQGYTVLRFSEQSVRYDIENVVAEIEDMIEKIKERQNTENQNYGNQSP